MVKHGGVGAWWDMVYHGVGAGVCLSDSTLEVEVSSPHHCCFSAVVIQCTLRQKGPNIVVI